MKLKKSIINLFAALSSQAVIMSLSIVIPRLVLVNYGSETNGYVSLVNQVYAYINILEAGLNTAVLQALYGPVSRNDRKAISSIINEASRYYHKIAVYYALAVLSVGIVLPFIVHSTMNKVDMILYFMFFGISNVINFWSTASMRPLLLAEGKNYVNSIISMLFTFLSQSVKIILLLNGTGIVTLQVGYALVNSFQIFTYYAYFRKNYNWIHIEKTISSNLIKQRRAFFLQQISNLIFGCTDVVLITLFCSLSDASVYAVYALIYNAISVILSMVVSSTQFVLGQTFNDNRGEYVKVHRLYETLLLSLTFILITVAVLLTIPFVTLYTKGVTDINYIDPVLPIMFSLVCLLSTCKSTSLTLINFSYHAEKTMSRTLFEAGVNIVLSLIFIPIWGIRGALLGTIIALLYRMLDTLYYTNRIILHDSMAQPLRLYSVNFLTFFVVIILCKNMFHCSNYSDFFIDGILIFFVLLPMYTLINILTNFRLFRWTFGIVKGKLSDRKKRIRNEEATTKRQRN